MRCLESLPLLLAILTFDLSFLFHVSTAIPFNNTSQRRELFSLEAYHQPNLDRRSLFNVDGIQDASQRDALRQGQRDALEMARVVLQHFEDSGHESKAMMWFGQALDVIRTQIKGVLTNFIGDDGNKEGADILGDVIVYPEDYATYRGTLFCSVTRPDGKTGTAYFKPHGDEETPGMHFCDKFFDRLDAKTFLDSSCSGIENHMNTDSMTRRFQGANVFHEFMHYPAVTLQPTGKQVKDFAYGAWSCFSRTAKVEDGYKWIHNADSWVWYVMHIYLTEVCGKEFSGPRGPQDD